MIDTLSMKERVKAVLSDPRILRAFEILEISEQRIEESQIRITQIAAPPFDEGARARYFADQLRAIGFSACFDAVGNVTAPYSELARNPVVVGAHLDTVFPADTPLELQRKGRVLCLPGISDNGAGLVALLWVLKAAKETGLRFRRPVLAVANVGEEGEGDLRGVRHLFGSPLWPDKNCDFVAIDGGGVQRITNQALGSRRFRVRMTGPGGHSWADFGRPNPIHALAGAVHDFVGAARRPGTSFNVGTIRGGIAVNAIPREACMELDLRSSSAGHLEDLHAYLKRCIAEHAGRTGVAFRMEVIGERPLGKTPPQSELVQAALETTRRMGVEPELDIGSTDANIPISLGIPAIAIGGGGAAGNIHTTAEWFDPSNRHLGLQRLLALIAVLAGLN